MTSSVTCHDCRGIMSADAVAEPTRAQINILCTLYYALGVFYTNRSKDYEGKIIIHLFVAQSYKETHTDLSGMKSSR